MYNSYNSLRESIQREIENQKSVLNKFPDSISRQITQSCSRYLAQFTSYQLPFKSDKISVELATQITQTTTTTSTSTTTQSQSKSQYASNSTNASINNSSTMQQNSSSNSGGDSNLDKSNIIQLDTPEQVNWTLEVNFFSLLLLVIIYLFFFIKIYQ
jgi:hypothetical protein